MSELAKDLTSEITKSNLSVDVCKTNALNAAKMFKHPELRTRLEEEINDYAAKIATIENVEQKNKMLEDFDDYSDVLKSISVLANKDYDRQQKAMMKNFNNKKV